MDLRSSIVEDVGNWNFRESEDKMKVENIKGRTGQAISNQFIIKKAVINGKMGDLFQSYNSVIAFIPYDHCGGITIQSGVDSKPHFVRSTKYGGQILLDLHKWDYSRTTGKYRDRFLGETKKETQAKIDSGEYVLTNLN